MRGWTWERMSTWRRIQKLRALLFKALQCLFDCFVAPSHDSSNFLSCLCAAFFRPASTQRDRHPAQQNVSQAKSVLSIEGGYCLGYNVIGMPAQRQTIFFTACRQPGDGQGLTAMPFGDGPRRGFRNAGTECDVACPLAQRYLDAVKPRQGNLRA